MLRYYMYISSSNNLNKSNVIKKFYFFLQVQQEIYILPEVRDILQLEIIFWRSREYKLRRRFSERLAIGSLSARGEPISNILTCGVSVPRCLDGARRVEITGEARCGKWLWVVNARAHFSSMRIMRSSACTLFRISGAVNSARRDPKAERHRSYKSFSRKRERERSLLSPLFVLSILASVSHWERWRNVRTRVSRSGPPGRSLHYVNSPPLASSASSRARFVRARAASPPILLARQWCSKAIPREIPTTHSSENLPNWSDILGQKW